MAQPSTGASTARTLPLRLCEVLEREYVAIHGEPARVPTWLLDRAHVDAPGVAALLRMPSQATMPAAIVAIRGTLERRGLAIPDDDGASDPQFAQRLVDALNALLGAPEMLYDRNVVDRDSDLWLVADVVARTPATSADDRTLVNRLLLEAAFPAAAIARADTERLARAFADIHALRGPENVASALCLSGGGIRSASFALGVLQGLARAGVLDKFDYLSTVSGGGYIGSWLSTWIHRHPQGLAGVVAELRAHGRIEAGALPKVLQPEADTLRFLRSYSHFLNPRAGLFSVDTWSWIGLYLRNLALNWLTLIPLLLIAIALPRLYASFLYTSEFAHVDAFPALFWLATLAALATLVCVTVNRPSISDPVRPARRSRGEDAASGLDRFMERFKRQGWVLALGVAPLTLFALLLSLFVWGFRGRPPLDADQIVRWVAATPWPDMALVVPYIAVQHEIVWGEAIVALSWLVSSMLVRRRDWSQRLMELAAMLFAGALTWALVAALSRFAVALSRSDEAAATVGGVAIHPAHLYAVFAVPVVVLAVLAGMTLFIGVVSKARWIEDEDREWWARFGSWMLIVVVAWIALAAVTIFGPPLLLAFPRLISAVGGVSGIAALLLGRSSLTSATGQSDRAREPAKRAPLAGVGINALATAAVVFFAVFVALLSLTSTIGVREMIVALDAWLPPTDAWPRSLADLVSAPRAITQACGFGEPWNGVDAIGAFGDANVHLQVVCQTPLPVVAAVLVALALLVAVASSVVNLNKFSLHAAYRIRIVRTFLGASRRADRRPNPFTGFDPLDNVQMHELQPGLLREADIVNLPRFVDALRDALDGRGGSAHARFLVARMCTGENDPHGVLAARLRHAERGKPVLKSLQRSLIESLNRVLETARLDELDAFRTAVRDDRRADVARYAEHGNRVFANRLMLEAAFADDIRAYEFPPPPPHKLVHVLNLTLNLVHGRRLAWQERKAAPFAVTPMHCGSYYLGYRASREYGGADGISIGTAAAVSGAAVSPNMGYSSSPVTALLLTLFNVRLGWWLGNPGIAGQRTYRLAEPVFSLRPLVAEALGLTDDRSPYVYLSDGGHFENMALYEMVMRRCRLIVASDAGADPQYRFDDLGNALRKIRVDLGIPIEFSSMPIHKRAGDVDTTVRYCALGRIRYSEIDGASAPDGVLIVIKPVICGREPRDVLNYAAQKERFPQEPTVDQFFGESQFESYRQLGEFETQTLCRDAPGATAGEPWAARVVRAVRAYVGADDAWIDAWLDTVSGTKRAAASDQKAADH